MLTRGRAGYFAKTCLELARTVSLSRTLYDCGTKHLIEIEIKDKKMLEKFAGRFYKENPDDKLNILVLNKKNNKRKDLIGKKLYFRSPVTCSGGDCICQRCYGLASIWNEDIADGVSGFEVEETTKVVKNNCLIGDYKPL